MKIILTGASGFIGSELAKALANIGHQVFALVRTFSDELNPEIRQQLCDLETLEGIPQGTFSNIDCVIHSAALAHVLNEDALVAANQYRTTNRDVTLNLAKLALEQGVKRFIFLSSIKVNGEETFPGQLFRPEDSSSPIDSYGISKYEAESGLLKLAAESEMEVVIIRPPLVYGPKVKANFATMVNWVRKEVPLPFASVKNLRSFIAIDNLIDFILLCADRARSPNATNHVFLIADNEDVSTSTLLRRIARAYGVKSHLFPMPVLLMRIFAKLFGKGDVADRLFGNLQLDSSRARKLLGWEPVITMEDQLKKMAEHDLQENKA